MAALPITQRKAGGFRNLYCLSPIRKNTADGKVAGRLFVLDLQKLGRLTIEPVAEAIRP